MGVDSGATETVIRRKDLSWIKTTEGLPYKRGVKYGMANGDLVDNEGEKDFEGVTGEGVCKMIKAQVCDVNQPLLSVRKVVAAGNRVIFDDEGRTSRARKMGAGSVWVTIRGCTP